MLCAVAECLHGGVDTGETGYGTTSFPQPISLAATFDRRLLHEIAGMIGDEMRAISNLYRQADGTARFVLQCRLVDLLETLACCCPCTPLQQVSRCMVIQP